MTISRIRIANFKSFADQTVELNDFNLLVGANASGKSNFVQVFKFLSDIATHGLEDAISLQGGVEYLRNIKIGNAQPLCFHLAVKDDSLSTRKSGWPLIIHSFEYEFSLRLNSQGVGFSIERDRLTLRCSREEVVNAEEREPQMALAEEKANYASQSTVEIFNSAGEVRMQLASSESGPLLSPAENDVLNSFRIPPLSDKTLLLESPFVRLFAEPVCNWFRSFGIYKFDPDKAKSVVPVAGRSELETDGSNLAVVLRNLLGDEDTRRSLRNLCRYNLSYLEDLGVEEMADRFISLKVRETFFGASDLPANLISDGTANIIALVVALFFQKQKRFAIFEEPDMYLHPKVLSGLMELFKEVSEKRQILVTTHSANIVKYAGAENILFVSRNREGFSRIARPADSEQVRIFLAHDLGIDDLFIDDLLGVGL